MLSFLHNWQDNVVFNPCPESDEECRQASHFKHRPKDSYRDLLLHPEDHVTLHAVWFCRLKSIAEKDLSQDDYRTVALIFHGNCRSVADWSPVATQLNLRGYDCVMPDYREYGKSKGELSEEGLIRDARLWYDTLLQLGYSYKHVIVHGISIGCALAMHLVAQVPVKELVLETPFDCLLTVAKHHVGRWLALVHRLVMKYRFDNIGCASRLNCERVSAIHAIDDPIVPFHAFEALSSELQLQCALQKYAFHEFILPAGGHNVRLAPKAWSRFLDHAYTPLQ